MAICIGTRPSQHQEACFTICIVVFIFPSVSLLGLIASSTACQSMQETFDAAIGTGIKGPLPAQRRVRETAICTFKT